MEQDRGCARRLRRPAARRRVGTRRRPSLTIRLFASWGGAPTTALLRFGGGGEEETVARRHELVTRATGVELPTTAEQDADPRRADAAYDAAVTVLRELTRDEKQFPLVVRENTEYGFRRNVVRACSVGARFASVVPGEPPERFPLTAFTVQAAGLQDRREALSRDDAEARRGRDRRGGGLAPAALPAAGRTRELPGAAPPTRRARPPRRRPPGRSAPLSSFSCRQRLARQAHPCSAGGGSTRSLGARTACRRLT